MKREIVFDQSFLEALGRLQVVASEPSGGRLEGARVGREVGAGIEFADRRAYERGDSPGEIDWRAFARFERLYVRLRSREEASNVHLLVDASASMDFGRPTKFTFARRVAGALAAVALAGLDAVTVGFLRGDNCEPGESVTGSDRLGEVLRFLEAGRPGGGTDVRAALGSFLDAAPARGVLVVLSDFWSETRPDSALAAARERGFEGALVQVLEPAELAPPGGGRLRLTDSETGAELEMEAARPVREAYHEEAERFFEELARAAAQSGFGSARLLSDMLLEDAILGDLRRAGVVR